MITTKVKQFIFALLGMAFLASCQKELDVNQSDLDQSRIRGLNGKLNAKAELGRKIYFDMKYIIFFAFFIITLLMLIFVTLIIFVYYQLFISIFMILSLNY